MLRLLMSAWDRRQISFIALVWLLSIGTTALGESANMDDVLKTSSAVSEQQLDEAAEQLIKQEVTDAKVPESSKKLQAKALDPKPIEDKVVLESQIPVLKEEKMGKQASSSPWLRLIGSALFVMVFAAGMFIAVKKFSKDRNVIGKKAKIEILHQHFLGPKRSIALIQVAGEAILIGITDHNINMIKSVALIDDESDEPQDFHGFLDDEFTVEQLTAQKSRTRIL
jgi:flagellar protein FliO/FliZ